MLNDILQCLRLVYLNIYAHTLSLPRRVIEPERILVFRSKTLMELNV
jgi:hypothetical protein